MWNDARYLKVFSGLAHPFFTFKPVYFTLPRAEAAAFLYFKKEGSPFFEIVRAAKREDADLVIVGTHGRGAIAHVLLGSVAEKVVRKAPCPVLTVREGVHDFVMP